MVTDDERRRVVAELRKMSDWDDEVDCTDFGKRVSNLLYRALGCDGTEGGFYASLADLIEPDEPPYNLYTLYETVLHRSPRCWECIEDDEVEELVDALLDICNAPGHDVIQRPQPSEPKVKCVAEVKVDGERLEELVHDAAVELTGIDRDALLALADEMEEETGSVCGVCMGKSARRIREALGVNDG